MDDIKQRVEEAEIDYWEAMAVSSAAMHIYEEAKSDYMISKERFRKAEHEMAVAKCLFDKQKSKAAESA